MERLLSPGAPILAVEDVFKDLTFPEPPADRPYTVLNFVTTLDGQVTLGDTGARLIGSETDHRLMRRLRTVADGLMHGAGTIRQDDFPPRVPPDLIDERLARGLAEQPLGVAVSASGNLAPTLRYFSGRPPAVFTMNRHQAALSRQLGTKATVFGVGEAAVDLAETMSTLRVRLGIRVLLSEGGPQLAHGMIAAGLVDELFLTLAPKLGSEHDAARLVQGPRFLPSDLPRLTLLDVLHHEDELFLRYRLSPNPVPIG
jgi:2,5-diamino-6-(ribosylamino)-4(3H)-pyrimidinone 5'-phosphate reductase